ncbi:TPA: hypothetical protein N0F65_001303 [Lagenidium giganteum]|uniref:C2H2-type domain-containing protein n=1 Tax=Lagenidium giganteum TaxID=4803 RepID=A0AAV2Z511_9STRA|nr:TPA: hypothetical protein N0F65_001303 [Lagenidium giganteum]
MAATAAAAASLRKVLVVIGTTGAGKTKLSIDLAKAVGGEIINSDAMQMYRGLDIATAKITEEEKEGIPHHLFDVVDPSSRCDVVEFKQLALRTIDDILARGKVPIIVGGTMYYTQSILWKSQLLDEVPAKETTKNTFDYEQLTGPQLHARLREVDPVMASRLHENNTRKIQRSLEVFYQTGKRHSDLIAEQEKQQRQLEKYYEGCAFWIHCNKQVLAERLAKRVDKMMDAGLVDEITRLRAHVKANPPKYNPEDTDEPENAVGILQAIGYKEFQPYLDALEAPENEAKPDAEGLDKVLSECVEQLNIATRQYARRQLTWIRNRFVTRNIPVYEVDSSDVSVWDTAVAAPAIEIARQFLAGQQVTTPSIQAQNPDNKELTLAEKYIENVCAICGDRKFTGAKQWKEHLRSKGHKYHLVRVAREKEQHEREAAQEQATTQPTENGTEETANTEDSSARDDADGESSPKRAKTS